MALDDIYGNKGRWERWISQYIEGTKILKRPTDSRRKYYCKNKENLKYYLKLIRSFEVDDLSYIRRSRLRDVMNILCFFIVCDLKNANSVERDEITIQIRKVTSPSQLKKTSSDVRRIGRILFEEDERPCFFKEFKIKTDISRQIARKDKLTLEEFDNIMKFFCNDVVIQSFLSLAFESLARPQELCYTKIEDLEIHENYAILNVSEHGKEGIKKLLSIDSFPYVLKMYNSHKKRNNKESFLFLNEYGDQLTPFAINKKIKRSCRVLEIDKPVTCYSIKRFGVTSRVLQGNDPSTIQKIAGWKSTKQLRTYDQSDQEDVFKIELAKRGLIKSEKFKEFLPETKKCSICGEENIGFSEDLCPNCKRSLDRDKIKQESEFLNMETIMKLVETVNELKKDMDGIKDSSLK
jgi:integrase